MINLEAGIWNSQYTTLFASRGNIHRRCLQSPHQRPRRALSSSSFGHPSVRRLLGRRFYLRCGPTAAAAWRARMACVSYIPMPSRQLQSSHEAAGSWRSCNCWVLPFFCLSSQAAMKLFGGQKIIDRHARERAEANSGSGAQSSLVGQSVAPVAVAFEFSAQTRCIPDVGVKWKEAKARLPYRDAFDVLVLTRSSQSVSALTAPPTWNSICSQARIFKISLILPVPIQRESFISDTYHLQSLPGKTAVNANADDTANTLLRSLYSLPQPTQWDQCWSPPWFKPTLGIPVHKKSIRSFRVRLMAHPARRWRSPASPCRTMPQLQIQRAEANERNAEQGTP